VYLPMSEEKYKTLFDSIDEGYCLIEVILDERGRPCDLLHLEANPAYRRLTGFHALSGKRLRELLPDIEQEWIDFCGQVALTGRYGRFERYVAALGKWFSAFASRSGKEGSLQVAVIFSDITERKRTEDMLMESEKKKSFLLKLSDTLRPFSDPVAIQGAVARLAMDFFKTDRCYYCEIEGGEAVVRREAVCGGMPSVIGVYPLGSFPIYKAAVEKGLPIRIYDVHTTELVDEDLRQLCVSLKIISCLDVPVAKNGKTVGLLCVVQSTPRNWTDTEEEVAAEIAERAWAAVVRAKAEETLAFQANLLTNVHDAIDVTDEKFNITYWNKMAEDMFGWTAAEVIGKRKADILKSVFLSDSRDEAIEALMKRDYFVGEVIYRHKDGHEVYTNVHSKVIRDKNGEVENIIFSFRDITERIKHEEALKKSQDRALALVAELKQSDENKTRFLRTLSHELRNPLAVIVASLSLLDAAVCPEQTENAKEVIHRGVGQLTKLVDDLLDITRISQDKIILHKEHASLNELIINAGQDALMLYRSKEIALTVTVPEFPVVIYADPVRIAQCLGNLLKNALTYTEQNGEVSLSLGIDHDVALIHVRDNGIGINKELLPHIFEPFTQGESSLERPSGGLGLGLSVVEGIARLHGGSVTAESAGIGKGSLFTMMLPLTLRPDHRSCDL
jgi:PAS domain S-box-containing protein